MFLENYSRVLASLVGCMALVQQGYGACIPPYRKSQGNAHQQSSVADLPTSTLPANTLDIKPTSVENAAATFPSPSVLADLIPTTAAAAVSTPTAVMPAKSTTSGNIIIPFYLYPSNDAWKPMEELIAANPNVKFTIIINPDNGSGSTALPDENFLAAVPRLTAFPNALVIGYVRTAKGTRDIAEVKKEIDTYAGWPSASGKASFAVRGIFLDEAPSVYDAAAVEYFQELAAHIKASQGLGPDNHVVTNPGTVPDAAYLGIPDTTVIFESPYSEFQVALLSDVFQSIHGQDLSRFASMVYDVPRNVDLSTVLSQLRAISSQTYVSNLDTYQAFDEVWSKVVSLWSV